MTVQTYIKSRLLNNDKIKILRTKCNVGGRFYKIKKKERIWISYGTFKRK